MQQESLDDLQQLCDCSHVFFPKFEIAILQKCDTWEIPMVDTTTKSAKTRAVILVLSIKNLFSANYGLRKYNLPMKKT